MARKVTSFTLRTYSCRTGPRVATTAMRVPSLEIAGRKKPQLAPSGTATSRAIGVAPADDTDRAPNCAQPHAPAATPATAMAVAQGTDTRRGARFVGPAGVTVASLLSSASVSARSRAD